MCTNTCKAKCRPSCSNQPACNRPPKPPCAPTLRTARQVAARGRGCPGHLGLLPAGLRRRGSELHDQRRSLAALPQVLNPRFCTGRIVSAGLWHRSVGAAGLHTPVTNKYANPVALITSFPSLPDGPSNGSVMSPPTHTHTPTPHRVANGLGFCNGCRVALNSLPRISFPWFHRIEGNVDMAQLHLQVRNCPVVLGLVLQLVGAAVGVGVGVVSTAFPCGFIIFHGISLYLHSHCFRKEEGLTLSRSSPPALRSPGRP